MRNRIKAAMGAACFAGLFALPPPAGAFYGAGEELGYYHRPNLYGAGPGYVHYTYKPFDYRAPMRVYPGRSVWTEDCVTHTARCRHQRIIRTRAHCD